MNFHHDRDRDLGVPVSDLPKPFQSAFSYSHFNRVQSACFPSAYLSDDNMVVSAPTGSGKTGLFELCILRLLTRCLTPENKFSHPRGTLKIVYIAPTKALIQEKVKEWNERFGRKSLGLVCQEMTSDSDFIHVKDLQTTDLILTTPEKFDSTTRRARDHGGAGFLGDVALLLIDEVHFLNDTRGAALEAIVSRMKMLASYPGLKDSAISRIRFVAVSATIPNTDDLGEWLRVPSRAIKRFGEEMRPVKLVSKVYGYSAAKNDFLFEKRLQFFLYDIIVQLSGGESTLVFCPTRKGAQDTATKLAETITKHGAKNQFIRTDDQIVRLQAAARKTNDKNMQSCIQCGVGFHSGGVEFAERDLVEGLFLRGDLQVLCTTMTLAHGINLPAHLVVIKSTQYYNKEQGRYMEYERSTLLQMCGRAGRPQFGDSGHSAVVAIMTKNETKHLYQNLLEGLEPVESELLPSIAEHLNAEIVLTTVSNVGLAIEWLKCSFLYIRLRKNPQHYGVKISLPEEQMDKHLKEICLQSIRELASHGMVEMDDYGFTLKYQEPGRLMAKYYLKVGTMKTITRIPERSHTQILLKALAESQELSLIQLRRPEKRQLNSINQETSSRIKFHVLESNGKKKKRIQTSSEKIFVLVNDALSGEPSTLDFTMAQDVIAICTHGARISRCMSEYFISCRRYAETKSALLLTKCLRQRLWDDSPYQLKQLPGIGMVTAKTFLSAGISNFEQLATSDPRHLEFITGRKYPFGDIVKSTLSSLPPKVELIIHETNIWIGDKREFVLELTRPGSATIQATGKGHMADLIVGEESGNHLLLHEKIRLEQFSSPYVVAVYSTSNISAALVSEQFVGVDIFREPVVQTHLDKASELRQPLKDQQRKRNISVSVSSSTESVRIHDQDVMGKLQSTRDKRVRMETSVSGTTSSNSELPITSYYRYGELATAFGAPNVNGSHGCGRAIQPGTDFTSVFGSPSGQDVRSLQSFLLDTNVQQNLWSDEGCFIDTTLVSPSTAHPLMPQQHLSITSPYSTATKLTNAPDNSPDLGCQDSMIENKILHSEECGGAGNSGTKTASPKPPATNIRLKGKMINEKLSETWETTKLYSTAVPFEGSNAPLVTLPNFNLGLPKPKVPREDENVAHNQSRDITCTYHSASGYERASTRSSYTDSSNLHDKSLGPGSSPKSPKSLFAFLYS